LDDLCDTRDTLAFGPGERLHDRWIHSYTAGCRNCCGVDQSNPGAKTSGIEAGKAVVVRMEQQLNSRGGLKMQAIAAKRVFTLAIAVLSMSLVGGCSHMGKAPKDRPGYLYYHKPLTEASMALDEARKAGKDKECPAEFNASKVMVDKAYEVYMACRTEEAIGIAQEAIGKIKALCPARAVAEVKPVPRPEPVITRAPEPKVEEKVIVLASEPKIEEKVIVLASEPKIEEKVIVLAFEDIHFDFDKSTLTKEAQVILKRNVRILTENPKAKVRIAGYTSASGTEAYNQKLSERRAKAVKDYLLEEGIISPDRLSKIGYGETNPAMYEAEPKNLYSEAAKANMRVLFEIVVR
jgi:outer membrane protein OmpA-like peptidoglycan-associated protein